jgi:hypothetical protein
MKGMVPPDRGSKVSQQRYAVVYVPRRNRKRFSAGAVEVYHSETEAMEHAEPEKHKYAAVVHGPSKSSEGQLLYYLIDWLRSD